MALPMRRTIGVIGSIIFLLSHSINLIAQPRISEFEPNPFGPDPFQQTVEISGVAGETYNGCIVAVDCDTSTLVIDRAVPVSGTFDANNLLTVSIPDLENPSFNLSLVTGACPVVGTSPLGQLTSANVTDSIGIPDSVTDVARCAPQALDPSLTTVGEGFAHTGDEPKLVFRDASRGNWFALNDPDQGEVIDIDGNSVDLNIFIDGDPFVSSFGAINPKTSFSQVRISEFEPNPFGSDPQEQFIEISGTAGNAFAGAIVSVDCDTPTLVIDRSIAINDIFDNNGLLTVSIADLENPSFTLLLVNGAAPPTGVSPIGQLSAVNVLDAIGIPDSPLDVARCNPTAIDPSLATVGEGFAFTGDEPKLVFRDASRGDWYALNDPDFGMVIDINGNSLNPNIFLSGDPFQTSFAAINPSTESEPPVMIPLPLLSLFMMMILVMVVAGKLQNKLNR